MIGILCVSDSETLDSEMRYNPICVSMKISSHEHELVNLNDSSAVSNDTQITTSTPTIFFTSDKKSLSYHGQTFILNCPMPKEKDARVLNTLPRIVEVVEVGVYQVVHVGVGSLY